MYTEFRPIPPNEIEKSHCDATNPSYWFSVFEQAPKFSLKVAIALRLDKRFRLINRYFKPAGRVLDAGCGSGDWVLFLKRHGYEAEGVDYSSQLVTKLRKEHADITWWHGRIQQLPLEADTFDGLISWGVIEHDQDGPGAALKEFLRILKRGGVIVVTVPINSDAAVASSKIQFPDRVLKDPSNTIGFFQYFMTETELKSFVESAGFNCVETGASGPALLAIVFPKLYTKVIQFPRVFWILNQFVKILFFWRKAHNMLFCVAVKP